MCSCAETDSEDETNSTIETICPVCASALNLQDVHLGANGDAFALARCSSDACNWTGDAIFALVDLDGS